MLENNHPPIASIKKRLFSAIIDFVIFWIFLFFLGYFFGEPNKGKLGPDGYVVQFGYTLTGKVSYLIIAIWLLFFPIIEGITGYSIGKKLIRIKVFKKGYSNVSFIRSFVRHIVDIADVFLYSDL